MICFECDNCGLLNRCWFSVILVGVVGLFGGVIRLGSGFSFC